MVANTLQFLEEDDEDEEEELGFFHRPSNPQVFDKLFEHAGEEVFCGSDVQRV